MTYLKGKMQTYRPKKTSIPVYERKIIAGKRKGQGGGDLYTIARAWVYGASADYPFISINFGLSNGAGSAFTSLTKDEFVSFCDFIEECKRDIQDNLPKLESDAALFVEARRKQDEMMSQIQSQAEMLRQLEHTIPQEE